jgi:hypothetical protein
MSGRLVVDQTDDNVLVKGQCQLQEMVLEV